MARSSLRLTNYGPAGNVFGGVRYKPSDPSFSSYDFGAAQATGLSTLPSTYKSITENSPDYAGLSSLFYDSEKKQEQQTIDAAGSLIAANKQLEIVEEMSSNGGGGRESDEGNSLVRSGLSTLGAVATGATLGPWAAPLGAFAGDTLGSIF